MQDYWNDPPDDQEPPEWYMTLEDVLEQQDPPQTVADAIRKAMEEWVQEYNAQHDIEPLPDNEEPIDFEELESDECPHGKKWGDCGACDHEGDLAFDAARERRLFWA
jgi:hypothetical protein